MALANGSGTYQFSDGNVDAAKSLGGTILLSGTGAGLYFLDVAVTANTTTTTAPAGSGVDSERCSSPTKFAVVA
jgi:hypothetical protein